MTVLFDVFDNFNVQSRVYYTNWLNCVLL